MFFTPAIGILLTALKDEVKKTETLPGNVEKVTFVKKTNSVARVFGLGLSFGISELFCHYSESEAYFYKGACVGSDKNEAARNLFSQGEEQFSKKNFQQAKDLYEAAYQTCCSGYHQEANYKNSKNHAQAEIYCQQAERALQLNQYAEAECLFEKALEICPDTISRKKYFETCSQNAKAEKYNEMAEQCKDRNDYKNAVKYYGMACNYCTEGYTKESLFKNNLDNTNAELYCKIANDYWNEENYAGAAEFYSKAYKTCSSGYFREKNFVSYRDNALAKSYFQDGLQNFHDHKFSAAKELFEKAYNTCNSTLDENSKHNFYYYLKNAKAEEAAAEGDKMFKKSKFKDAEILYSKAFTISSSNYHNNIVFKRKYDNMRAEIFNQEGTSLFNDNKFIEAQEQFRKAAHNSSDVNRKSIFLKNIKKAEDSIERMKNEEINRLNALAERAHKEGNEYFSAKKFAEASEKYDFAFNTSTNNDSKKLYKQKKLNAEAESAFEKGLLVLKNGEYIKAQECFSIAYETCTVGYEKENIFKNYRNNTDAEILNSEGKELLNQDKYSEAMECFKAAIKHCSSNYNRKEVFEKNFNKAKRSIDRFEKDALDLKNKAEERYYKQQALKLYENGLDLYKKGKLKESQEQIELALDAYQEALEKFNEGASIKVLDVFFNAFHLLIDAFIKNGAYDSALLTINAGKRHFPNKESSFNEALDMINEDSWSDDYLEKHLIKESHNNNERSIFCLLDINQ